MSTQKTRRFEATTVSGRVLSSYAPDAETFGRRLENRGEKIDGAIRCVPLDGVPWTLEDNQYAKPPGLRSKT